MTDAIKTDLRVCVCGGRKFTNEALMQASLYAVADYCDANNFNLIIVEGEAKGADALAKAWAVSNGIPVRSYKAEWTGRDGVFNPKAGARRNHLMANNCDRVIAFWDGVKVRGTPEEIAEGKGKGSGTWHMISRATKAEFSTDLETDVPVNVIHYVESAQPKRARVESDFSFLADIENSHDQLLVDEQNDVGLAQSESAIAQQNGEISDQIPL